MTDGRKGTTSYTYYADDQVETITEPASGGLPARETSFFYDAAGRRVRTVLPDGSEQHIAYHPSGQVSRTWGSQQYPVGYTYDAQGRMLTQSTWQQYNAATGEGTGTPALTRWIYDPATGQLAQKQHADGKGPSYGYTPGGRLASRTWARGTSTTYVYDDAGMMRSLDHSDSTPDVAFSYTRTGQLDTVQDGALSGSGIATPRFTHSYTYSSIGQLTSESSQTTVGRTLTRVYEIDGTVPGRSIGWDLHTPDDPADAPSHWQRYGFDGAGRLNAVSSPAGEYSYTYVDQSHLLASVSGPVHTVTNSYESGRDTMTAKVNATSSSTISRFGARYDALGRRIETSRSGSAFAQNFVSDYQYDLLGQLTSDARFEGSTPGAPDQKLEEESFAFLYDGIGNRLTARKGTDSTAYTPNALNQYTAIDGIEPVYDADGNLFSDGKNRFHWDAENRLTLVEPLVATEGSKRLEFKYDYIGRRVSKKVWTHTGGSWTDTSTTAFVYDGWNLIEEVSTSSQTASINHYTWGLDLSLSLQGAGGVGGLLSVVCAPFTESGLIGDWLLPIGYVLGAPSTFHYTFDLNGNVSELLDSTGSIAAHYEFGPFGETLVENYEAGLGTGVSSFRFSTKYYDTELKTYYYGHRYYNPSHGRWLNRDPIEESGGLNLYGFVGNNGVNRWDYLGQYFGIDDAVFTLGGGTLGVAGLLIVDAFSGSMSDWEDYVGAFVGGAVTGEMLLYTGPVAAGLAGGAAGNLTNQGIKYFTQNKSCDPVEFTVSTVVGGLTGFIPGQGIPGLNAGRNSYNAIYNQIVAKAEAKSIQNITGKTALKMFAGRAVDKAFLEGAGVGSLSGYGTDFVNNLLLNTGSGNLPNRVYYMHTLNEMHDSRGRLLYSEEIYYYIELPALADAPVINNVYMHNVIENNYGD